jgi:hypothetical protein
MMNKPAASNEAHVDVALRLGDVQMLSWTKICRLPSEKKCISIISGPTSSLQKNHLAPAASVVDNNECQRHNDKLILPDLKNGEKTKLSI